MRLKRVMLVMLLLALITNTIGLGGTAALAATTSEEISSLVLNKNELTMEVGDTAALTATAVYVSGSTATVTVKTEWNSGSPEVASVYAGTVTAKSEGKAVITATYLGQTVVVNVTVVKRVRTLVKDKQTVDLRKGESEQITLTAYYDDGTTEDVTKKAEWNSDSSSVATVVNGLIKGQNSGQAVVTAAYNGQSVSIPVNVEIVKRIDPDKRELSLLLDESETLKLTATYPDGSVTDVTELADWESNDPDIADVIKGEVKGYGSGQTYITATYGTKTTTIRVDVDLAVKLNVNKTSLFLKKDATEEITLTATYADGSTDSGLAARATWTTSDPAVATVTKGKIIANGTGEATITATYVDKTVSILVDVNVPRLLIVDQEELFLQTKQTAKLALTATYANGTTEDVTDKAEWTTADSSIAYVQDGSITTYKAGKTEITATYGDKSVKVALSVDVPTTLLLSTKKINFQIGSTEQVKLEALFSDGTQADITSLAKWSTSDADIADVTKGMVTGIGTGVATITVEYGTRKATLTASVGVLKSLTTQNDQELTLKKGDKLDLKVSAAFTDGTSKDVTGEAVWTSSNSKTVTVDEGGHLVAAASGTATVTASFGGKTCEFDVQVDTAQTLTASPTLLVFDLGEIKAITLTAKDRDGNAANVTATADWTTSNASIATVDKGVVTPVARGKVTITAKYGGQSVSISAEIGVAQALNASKRVVNIKSGESIQITLNSQLSDNSKKEIDAAAAVWKSNSYNVADVMDGLITGMGPGTTTVTATFGGKSVTVTVNVDTLKYLQTDHVMVNMTAGSTMKVTATATYADQTEEDVSIAGLWTTSNMKVADVKNGVIRANGKGKATITVTFAKKKTYVYVTVN
ncbi:Ig-like domain-containing protein [Paenibacillus sp. YN15]|uniref:Ig-like domain-containing protein n=1 Tax=Paenibacillus sp. YN15 TaxID=1742774 RepID=UPI0015EB30A5|nr:Ig-like domain-containing protein [Paenibacillus sp. YN15]